MSNRYSTSCRFYSFKLQFFGEKRSHLYTDTFHYISSVFIIFTTLREIDDNQRMIAKRGSILTNN